MKFDKPIQDGLKNRKISEKKKKKFSTIFAEMFKIVHSAAAAPSGEIGFLIVGKTFDICPSNRPGPEVNNVEPYRRRSFERFVKSIF